MEEGTAVTNPVVQEQVQQPQAQAQVQGVQANSKAADIRAFFKSNVQFTQGGAVLANVKNTKSPNVIQCMFVQERTINRPGVSSVSNPLLIASMGWENNRLLRTWHNFDLAILQVCQASIGDPAEKLFSAIASINEDFAKIYNGQAIAVSYIESHTPRSWSGVNGEQVMQSPLVNPNNNTELKHEGKPVFSNTELTIEGTVADFLFELDQPVEIPAATQLVQNPPIEN